MNETPDKVILLHKPTTAGTSFFLNVTQSLPVDHASFEIAGVASSQNDAKELYKNILAEKVAYADGMPDGLTIRLHMKAGSEQKYTWRNGAREHGFLGSDRDFRNHEATIYLRAHGYNNTHTSLSWILRGGLHEGIHNSRASCIGLQVPFGHSQATIFKELDHPDYDFVNVNQKFNYSFKENEWLAVKVVSFLVEKQTKNFLYLDTDPYDKDGKPRNNFRLYSEWEDKDGISTGQYNQAAIWAGLYTTFRLDGWKSMDVGHLSVYEIEP